MSHITLAEEPITPARPWPFVASPALVASLLQEAYIEFNDDMLAAVRNVFIEHANLTRLRQAPAPATTQKPVAIVIKRGADRLGMSERLGPLPDGTYSLYTAPQPTAAAAAERAGPDGRLHADGYFTWNKGQRPDYIADRGLPCDFYLTPPQAPAPVEAPQQAQPAEPSKDAERLAWIHYHLTGTSIRGTIVNVLSNRSSYAEFIAAIDAARAAQGGKGGE
jgi:hypothetical protein